MLSARLSQCGLSVSAAGIAGLACTAKASLPAALMESTARIGILVAAGEAAAVASVPVAALSEGVMKAMLLGKLKAMVTVLVVGCSVLAMATAGWQSNAVGAANAQPVVERSQKPQRDADKDRIAELEKERDRLLKEVAELKSMLAKMEATQQDLLKMMTRDTERRKIGGDAYDKRENNDPKAEFQKLEDERAKWAARERPKENLPVDPVIRRRIEIEEQLARDAANRSRPKEGTPDGPQPKRPIGDERPKTVSGDERVAALEERMKQMERNMERMLAELERLRRK